MEITAALEQMSTEEKIRTMETIWDDLCRKAESISSPTWHTDVLSQREEQLQNGKDEFMDWNQAKEHIRNKVL